MDKKIIIGIILGVLVLSLVIASNLNNRAPVSLINEDEIENLHEVKLAIEGMSCEGCAYGVKAQIEGLEGVVSADIDYKNESGKILYDADKISAQEIAIASTVYPANIVEDKPR